MQLFEGARRQRRALVTVGALVSAAGCLALASGSYAGAAPQRAREPDNSAPQSTGPVGASGIILHDGTGRDPDFFYFKIAAEREVQISVKNLNGRCGSWPDADEVRTATVPEGQLHYFESVARRAGSIESYSVSPFRQVKLIVGVLYPNIGDNGSTNRGCSELVRVNPSSALILTRSPRDEQVLRAPILADQ